MKRKGHGPGWHNHPHEHAMAARGIPSRNGCYPAHGEGWKGGDTFPVYYQQFGPSHIRLYNKGKTKQHIVEIGEFARKLSEHISIIEDDDTTRPAKIADIKGFMIFDPNALEDTVRAIWGDEFEYWVSITQHDDVLDWYPSPEGSRVRFRDDDHDEAEGIVVGTEIEQKGDWPNTSVTIRDDEGVEYERFMHSVDEILVDDEWKSLKDTRIHQEKFPQGIKKGTEALV